MLIILIKKISMQIKKVLKNSNNYKEHYFLKKYVVQKIFWAIIALLLVVMINILINKYLGNYFTDFAEKVSENYMLTGLSFFISEIIIGIFPTELFMMIYQTKATKDYFLIVFVLAIISSICGFMAFLAGKYLKSAKISRMIFLAKKI